MANSLFQRRRIADRDLQLLLRAVEVNYRTDPRQPRLAQFIARHHVFKHDAHLTCLPLTRKLGHLLSCRNRVIRDLDLRMRRL